MATIETMTVHKALAELKMLDKRIPNEIQAGVFCEANKHSNEKIGGISVKDYEKKIQGCYDKIAALISRRNAIKRAVFASNATTKVQINGQEYSVAEAIEMKNHGINYEFLFTEKLRGCYNASMAEIKRMNGTELEERADQYVTALYGNKEGKNVSVDAEKTRQEFLVNNSYELIDPINITEKIEEISAKTSAFMAEVDAALSVSNALTEITIEY